MTSTGPTSFLHIPSSRPMLKKRHTTPNPLEHLSTLEALPAPPSARTPTSPSWRRALSPPPEMSARPHHSKQSSFLPFDLPPVVFAMLDLPHKSPTRSSHARQSDPPPRDFAPASPQRWSSSRNKDVMPSIEVVMGLSSAQSSIRSKHSAPASSAAPPSRPAGTQQKGVGSKSHRETLKLPLMAPPMSGTRSPVPTPSGEDEDEDEDWDFVDHVARRPSYQSSLRSEYERMNNQRSLAPRPRVRSQDYPAQRSTTHDYGLAYGFHDAKDDPDLSAAGILEELSGHLLEQEWPDELVRYASVSPPNTSRSRAGTSTTGQTYLSDSTLPSYHESLPPPASDEFGSDLPGDKRQSKEVKSVRSWREARKKSKQPSSPRPMSEQPPPRLRKPSFTYGRPAPHPPPTVPLPQIPDGESPEPPFRAVHAVPASEYTHIPITTQDQIASSGAYEAHIAEVPMSLSTGDAPPIPPRSAARPPPTAGNPTKLPTPQRELSGSTASDPKEGIKVPLVLDASRLPMLRPGGEDVGIVGKATQLGITPAAEMAPKSPNR